MDSKQSSQSRKEQYLAIPNFDFEYSNVSTKAAPKTFRKIVTGKPDLQLKDNKINTSKYNFVSFIPRNIIEQFSRIANIYFLVMQIVALNLKVIGIMQTIKTISLSYGRPDIFIPLAFITFITGLKDLFEDIKRHRSDKEENTKKCTYLDPSTNTLKNKCWHEVRVGDIIKIAKDEYLPSDLLVLQTSDRTGQFFIETKNLDGETNLKHKKIPPKILKAFRGHQAGEEYNTSTRGILEFEMPNVYLYSFNGNFILEDGEKIPVDAANFMLRGCSLRNTDFIYGLVTYTGHETKIMLNSVRARTKRSRVENLMNRQVIIVFSVQIIICFFCAAFYSVWYSSSKGELEYLEIAPKSQDDSISYNFGTKFASWILIFANFVPISLLVTLEMVKFLQGFVIVQDPMMFDSNKTPTMVQSSGLNEELGQIEYVFSDKTGTLTQNYMEFKKLIVNNVVYGDESNLRDEKKYPVLTNVNFKDQNFIDALNNDDKWVEEYLLALAFCHTVITEKKDGEIIYNAASPDELALINFAKFVGCEYLGLDDENNMTVHFKNKVYKYLILNVLEFNSKRKRMSVILKDQDGNVVLFCKGADSVILERMSKDKNANINDTTNALMKLADEGLRTLLIAKRVLPLNEYTDWLEKYKVAQSAEKDRQDKMESMQEEIEKNLVILGATAIEDKLQDQVADTIAFMKKAGIKVWVLTGDKIETAINIGFSCALLNNTLKQFLVDGKTVAEIASILDKAIKKVKVKLLYNCKLKEHKVKKPYKKYSLVVSGDALIQINQDKFLASIFLDVAKACEAVLCCRVSPKQKAEVVTLVRKNMVHASTLAIGDGANDVNMITAAHVGVGIRGVEGQQAARASDYAIGEFKLLKRLIFNHGRESYRKNSNLVLFNFFKNMNLVLPTFWIGFVLKFSGQRVYESWLNSIFNVFFASLPIVIYAVFDREFADESLMKFPFLYEDGPKRKLFNPFRFWTWFANGAFQAVMNGYLCLYTLNGNFVNSDGKVVDIWFVGTMIFGIVVCLANFKVLTFSNTHSILSLFIIFGSIIVYIIAQAIISQVRTSELYKFFYNFYSIPLVYLGFFVMISITTMGDFAVQIYGKLIRSEYLASKRAEYEEQEKNYLLASYVKVVDNNNSEKAVADTREEPLSGHKMASSAVSADRVISKNVEGDEVTTTQERKRTILIRTKTYPHSSYAFSKEENFNPFLTHERPDLFGQ